MSDERDRVRVLAVELVADAMHRWNADPLLKDQTEVLVTPITELVLAQRAEARREGIEEAAKLVEKFDNWCYLIGPIRALLTDKEPMR